MSPQTDPPTAIGDPAEHPLENFWGKERTFTMEALCVVMRDPNVRAAMNLWVHNEKISTDDIAMAIVTGLKSEGYAR